MHFFVVRAMVLIRESPDWFANYDVCHEPTIQKVRVIKFLDLACAFQFSNMIKLIVFLSCLSLSFKILK